MHDYLPRAIRHYFVFHTTIAFIAAEIFSTYLQSYHFLSMFLNLGIFSGSTVLLKEFLIVKKCNRFDRLTNRPCLSGIVPIAICRSSQMPQDCFLEIVCTRSIVFAESLRHCFDRSLIVLVADHQICPKSSRSFADRPSHPSSISIKLSRSFEQV